MGRISHIIDSNIDSYRERSREREYLRDPVLWARDHLGIQLWSKQAEVAMAVVDNKNVIVKAGHEVGKSFLAGILICWWVDTHWQLPGGCFVVSTAPSTKQINAVVWREVRKFHQLSAERFAAGKISHKLPGYITSMAHWRLENGIELGYGSKPPDSKEDTMSGIHARYVLAVGDEAVGLSETLIDDLGNITSNGTSRRFLILNPTNPLSYVAKIFKNKIESWWTATVSVFDSPNFRGGEGLPVEVLETLVDQTYVDDKLSEWGSEKSPKYISRVLGEFAWDMGFTLIPMEDMATAVDTEIRPSSESRPVIGVDVSRSVAGDMNTVYVNHDGKLRLFDAWNERNAIRTAEKIHEAAMATGATEVRIDGSGLGGPICDMVYELAEGHDYEVFEMIGGERSPDRARYFNARAYWYASFAEKLRDGKIDIDFADDNLQEELLGIEIKKRTAGLDNIQIESKEDMRKRGVSSPDYADAAIYAMADVDYLYGPQPGEVVAPDIDEFVDTSSSYFSAMPALGW
jgi:hypothetical protein